MYAWSLGFLLASLVALLMGLRQGGLTLIFVSIGSSVLAALFLAASVLRRASSAPPEERAAGSVGEWTGGSSTSQGEGGPLAGESLVGIIDRPLAGRHREPAGVPPVGSGVDRPGGVLGPDVMVLFDVGTYHLLSCEQVAGRGTPDRMKRAVAKRLGYTPCAVCRPG